jgi:hypothetical protein
MSGHELVAFLQAQFDEDEAEISKHPDDEYCEPQGYLADIEQNYPCSPYLRIGKTRALAEVAVKRRIIDRHQPRLVESRDGDGIERESYHCSWDDDDWPCEDLRDQASVYATYPDYNPEWRPA